jgi:hypothetical protein
VTVRLFLDETFATSTYTHPVTAGALTPPDGLEVVLVPRLGPEAVGAQDAALIASPAVLSLQDTHAIAPEIAVVAQDVGAVAMRVPVRPDEIEATPVRLLDTGLLAEWLARALLHTFYGIEATSWVRDGNDPAAAQAEVVIVEGAEALREPEGGFSEDLVRAWYILHNQFVVSHLLLLPSDATPDEAGQVIAFLAAARESGLASRREWRTALAERERIVSAQAGAFWSAQELTLAADDRDSLLLLLNEGRRGTSASAPANVTFREGAAAT